MAWGSNEPVIQLDMELDTMEPQKLNHWSQHLPGKLQRGGGQANREAHELVHSFTMNWRYFHTSHAKGTWRYMCCMSIDTVHSFSLMEDLAEAWVSILNHGMTRWLFRWERSNITPGRDIRRNSLVSCFTTGFIAPLDKSMSTAVWKSSGAFLVVKEMGFWVSRGCDSHCSWTPLPTVCDAWQSLSSLCCCGAKAARQAPTHSISMTVGRGSSSSNKDIPAAMSSVTSASSSFHSLLLKLSSLLLLAPASHGGLTEGLLITSGSRTGMVVEWTPTVPDRVWLASAGRCRNVKISRPATMQNLLFMQPHNFCVTPLVPDP